jgi:hypothetical protein
MADGFLPSAKSARSPNEREKLRRVVVERGLCGLANDTKWDEFVGAMRAHADRRPSYRCKCIDGTPSGWDAEWCYHLPFPLLSIEWLDIAHLQEVREHRLPPRVSIIDHSVWLLPLLKQVGLDFQVGASMIRVFGYSPRSMELFDKP